MDEFIRAANSWLSHNKPVLGREGEAGSATDRARAFMAKLYNAGYSGISWPTEYGGQGRSVAEEREFSRLAKNFDLPTARFSVGVGMCGPTLLAAGTEDQKHRYIGPILRGEEIWCQLFSEPGAGSDVAGLQTRATHDGQRWLINGQKVWTSGAHDADLGLLLARTDSTVPKHQGLTMFVIDMAQPGVQVRPLRDMTGMAHFNEVFFDSAEVAEDAVVGGLGKGWAVAQIMLGYERSSIGQGSAQAHNPASFSALTENVRSNGELRDPGVTDLLAQLYVKERALALLNSRQLELTRAGRQLGASASVAKILNARLTLFRSDVMAELRGDVTAYVDSIDARRRASSWMFAPAMSLGGGTNEIMLNIISERVLGLPRETSIDRAVAFNDVAQNEPAGSLR